MNWTLTNLSRHYDIPILFNELASRKYVEIPTKHGSYYVIENGMSEPETHLVAGATSRDYFRVSNHGLAQTVISYIDSIGGKCLRKSLKPPLPPTLKAEELFSEMLNAASIS